jgi:hypothetical protein
VATEINLIRQAKIMTSFQTVYTKETQTVWDKIYKLCDSKGYTYMSVYLGRDRNRATATITANHATVSGLTTKIENLGHKLYMDNVFSSDLSDDLHTKAINCCGTGTVRPNQKGMPSDFGRKLKT